MATGVVVSKSDTGCPGSGQVTIRSAAADLSRPDQDFAWWVASAPYSLDKADEPGYLCLTGYQEKTDLVVNHFKKSVQLIGG